MRVAFLLSALAGGAVLSGAPALAADHFSGPFQSESIKLPTDARTFDGPDADLVNRNCLGCHSVDMVTVQPNLPSATWSAEIAKMRTAYHARIADADVAPILAYLVRIKGTGQ